MNVILVSAVYLPEPVVSARITADLGQYLREKGHNVTVICPFPSRPFGTKYPDTPARTTRVDTAGGELMVVRVPSFRCPASTFMGRFRESVSFGKASARFLQKFCRDADVIYANTWPLMAQASVARVAGLLNIPFVLHVQDIYPEILSTRVSTWMRRLVTAPLRAWDRRVAQSAAKVVLVAEGARAKYLASRGLKESQVALVSNWQDEEPFLAALRSRSSPDAFDATQQRPFTFLYLGNISPTTGLEAMIKAFAQASLPDARLRIIGDGSRKDECVSLVKELRLSAVTFASCSSPAEVPGHQSLATVCLLPIKRGGSLNGVPSKLAAYMFSAKPVLAAVDLASDTARAIGEAECGWIEEPEDVGALAARMRSLTAMPRSELEGRGQNGREYGLQHFSKAEGVRKLAAVVLGAARIGSSLSGRGVGTRAS